MPGPTTFAGLYLVAAVAANLHVFNWIGRGSNRGPRRLQRDANLPNGRREDPALSARGAVIANEARRAEALAPEGISG